MNTVLILSYTKDMTYYNMLKECIESIDADCDVVVVETNSKLEGKDIKLPAQFIFPEEEFNYNRFLNIGFSHIRDSKKVIISNNDVIYDKGCIEKLFKSLDVYDSVSPSETKIDKNIEGNTVGKLVKGWCIGLNMEVYNRMGEWDENFSFWYQDNDYCNFISREKFKHCLIGDAVAVHRVSASHSLVSDIHEMTHGLEDVLHAKWVK